MSYANRDADDNDIERTITFLRPTDWESVNPDGPVTRDAPGPRPLADYARIGDEDPEGVYYSLAMQQAADAALMRAIRFATMHEGSPTRRAAIKREAFLSPSIAALHAHSLGYAEGVEYAERRLAALPARTTRRESRAWAALALAVLPVVACLALVGYRLLELVR